MPTLAQLRARLPELMLRDQRRLERMADRAGAQRDPAARERAVGQLAGEVESAAARLASRTAAVPVITYPPELPVSQRKDELAAAIRDHQVVIIAGETGSGKTTQLPKICLELGRGRAGQIGHTQPRRVAARTVAERIAAELGTELGTTVGYKVRFADNSSDGTLIKVMTDGILLTEMQRDRLLLRYDTLIIDEAHERSLNIDFILGYLKRLLPRRPDLKVIITSATIDPERFSRHFAPAVHGIAPAMPGPSAGGVHETTAPGEPGPSAPGVPGPSAGGVLGPSAPGVRGPSAGGESAGAPILEVSGRTYPVEVRYRPLADPDRPEVDARDQTQGILDAIDELRGDGPGDILVFLSGEREIRDTADALADVAGIEVLPLYARLSAAEQYRVFQPHSGRRVVLATNVAETSLTVPGIRYVVDPGTARISRYSQRTKVQRLPIEPISQASANQRKGRCGRTSDGICIRLYEEADFASRPEFTDPEVLRTNLASVILRMAALDLGAMSDFPFVDPPDSRNVADGVRLLEELGAIAVGRGDQDGRTRLTATGRKLADLPVDPRLGRMILESGKNGCAREVLIITAALSIQDPRERPADSRDAADAVHRRFAEPGSDFLSFVTLWDYLREQQRILSGSAFRRMCRREYLHYLRVREWQDVYGQLRQAAREFGVVVGRDPERGARPAAPTPQPDVGWQRASEPQARYSDDLADRVHQSLMAGLLSHLGMQDTDRKTGERRRGPVEFAGARGARFAIFPDSPMARKPPPWVMAAELVETSRLWARTVAKIEPEWAEQIAGHLVRRSYSEPRWDAQRGAVMATERVALYGLPIVADRTVNFGRVDPATARDLFIQHALVERDWQTHHKFVRHNERILAEARQLEDKARRRGIVADDSLIFGFYDKRIPKTVTSARHFDAWWKRARTTEPDLLNLSLDDLVTADAADVRAEDYPENWGAFPLSYAFAPGEAADGVTVEIPLEALNQGNEAGLGWQVPGRREELVTELIRGLPKDLRRLFVPAPDTARRVMPNLGEPHGDLLDPLSRELGQLAGIPVPKSAFDISKLPPHLRVTYRVMDGGKVAATGKDLTELRRELRPRLQAALTDAAAEITRTGLRDWTIGALPRVFTSGQVTGYPALADAGDSVDVRMFPTRTEATQSMLRGTRRLILLQVPSGARSIAGRLPVAAKMAMSRHPYANAAALVDDCAACAADEVILDAGGPAWDAAGFARLVAAARDQLAVRTAKVVEVVARVLGEAHEVEVRLSATPNPALGPAMADMSEQFAGLIHCGFISETGAARLPDLVRYLRAMVRRLDKLPGEQGRDTERMAAVHRVSAEYRAALAELSPGARLGEDAVAVRWMIEELRVNLFAQVLGTPYPVSEKRIRAAIDALPRD